MYGYDNYINRLIENSILNKVYVLCMSATELKLRDNIEW